MSPGEGKDCFVGGGKVEVACGCPPASGDHHDFGAGNRREEEHAMATPMNPDRRTGLGNASAPGGIADLISRIARIRKSMIPSAAFRSED